MQRLFRKTTTLGGPLLLEALLLAVAACGEPPNGSAPGSSRAEGKYLEQRWHVDDNRLMHWNGAPYIPYTSFGMSKYGIENDLGVQDFHFWIDTDRGNEHNDPSAVDRYTTRITASGGTYTVQIMTGIKNYMSFNAGDLFQQSVKDTIIDSWRPYVPAIKKRGLRAIILFNEINVEWTWNTHSDQDYARVLADYAREMKALVGDVPIMFKTTFHFAMPATGRTPTVNPMIAATQYDSVDGVVLDVYALDCTSRHFDAVALARSYLLGQHGGAALWVGEFGNENEDTRREPDPCKEAVFPVFTDRAELTCFVDKLRLGGATGFIYFGLYFNEEDTDLSRCDHLDLDNSIRWFAAHQSTTKSAILDH